MIDNLPVVHSFFPALQHNHRYKQTNQEEEKRKYLIIKVKTFPAGMFHVPG
jgi:hypothetical protein